LGERPPGTRKVGLLPSADMIQIPLSTLLWELELPKYTILPKKLEDEPTPDSFANTAVCVVTEGWKIPDTGRSSGALVWVRGAIVAVGNLGVITVVEIAGVIAVSGCPGEVLIPGEICPRHDVIDTAKTRVKRATSILLLQNALLSRELPECIY
jgi:hypothetical protein